MPPSLHLAINDKAETPAWGRYFSARLRAAWTAAIRVRNRPMVAGPTVLSDPRGALLDQCWDLAPGQKLTFLPDAVAAAYGTPTRAMFDLRSDLGDPLAKLFRIRFYADGSVAVSLVEPLAPARTSSQPGL